MWSVFFLLPFLWMSEPRAASTRSDSQIRYQASVDAFVKRPTFRGLDVGVAVGCVGETPASHLGDKLLNPASGTKLLTTAAALKAFKPNERFELALYGKREGSSVSELTLVASGDPSLDASDLKRLAKELAKTGIKQVKGSLRLDLSGFSGGNTPPAYDQKNTDAAYHPEVPAFGINSGVVGVTVRPGRALGDKTRVTLSHEVPSILVENSAHTVAGKRIDQLRVDAVPNARGQTVLKVSGSLGIQAPAQGVRKRVERPDIFAGEWLIREIRAEKIKYTGNVQVLTKAPSKKGEKLASIFGKTVAESIAIINQRSNNFMAESLFRLLGKEQGQLSWKGAQAATRKLLEALGLPGKSFDIVNGSGLYDATRISANGMVRLLSLMHTQKDISGVFRDSLAKAGEEGTLAGRMKSLKGKVFAKTGTLDKAISLSGYMQAARCTLSFAVIVNGAISGNGPNVTRDIDKWLTELAN